MSTPTPQNAEQWQDLLMYILTDVMGYTKNLNIAAHHSSKGFVLVVTDDKHRVDLQKTAEDFIFEKQ